MIKVTLYIIVFLVAFLVILILMGYSSKKSSFMKKWFIKN
jgi:preprotein translocase subunit SecG